MSPRLTFAGLLGAAVAALGCATAITHHGALVWPPEGADAPGEVRLVGVITAFRHGGARGVLRAIAGAGPHQGGGETALAQPVAVAVAPGKLAVVDTALARVTVSDLAGQGSLTLRLPSDFRPSAAAFEAAGSSIIVCDGPTGAVRRFAASGAELALVAPAGTVTRCGGLATCRDGDILLTDTAGGAVVRLGSDGRVKARSGSRGDGAAQFNFPTAIAEAPDGTIWVLDTLNFRVRRLDPALSPLGEFGEVGDGSGLFALPKGMAVDPEGHVYVSDARFDRIQVFDDRGRLLLVVGAPGAEPGQFWSPAGLTCAADGTIAVADTGNRRVQVLRYAPRRRYR